MLEILTPLCGACRDSPNAEGLRLYATLLADLDPEHLKAAIARHLTESEDRWFPAVGRLRKLAAEAAEGSVPGWEAAWELITRAADVWCQSDRERAERARAMVGEALMPFVRLLGGFYNLANADGGELTVLQSNFRNAWSSQKTAHERLRAIPEGLRPSVAALPSAARVEAVARICGGDHDART